MIFCDTTILVSAVRPGHEHHHLAFPLYAASRRGSHAVAAHSMAEMYSFVSGAQNPKVSPKSAYKLVTDAASRFTWISLDSEEVLAVLDRCSESGVTGGTVYDALIVACARKVRAEAIYTFNLRDFLRVAPDLASVIQSP